MKHLFSLFAIITVSIIAVSANAEDSNKTPLPKMDSVEYRNLMREFKDDAFASCIDEAKNAPNNIPKFDPNVYCVCGVSGLVSKLETRIRDNRIKTYGDFQDTVVEVYSQVNNQKGEFWNMILACMEKARIKKK